MIKLVFDYEDYRSYLNIALPTKGEERGKRAKLATSLGVQKGFISAVLNGSSDFSLEQSYKVSRFLNHTDEERDFFLLLVQKARAGSKDLETYFGAKVEAVLLKRREVKERIVTKESITEQDRATYYSSWHYTAVHMCLMVPSLGTPQAISRYLGISQEIVVKVLEFFIQKGLATIEGNRFSAGPTRIHIPADSPFVSKHHVNWRVQSIRALDAPKKEDLHYSLVTSISESAAMQIREILLKAIQSTEPVIKEAKDEQIYALNLDLFSLQNG